MPLHDPKGKDLLTSITSMKFTASADIPKNFLSGYTELRKLEIQGQVDFRKFADYLSFSKALGVRSTANLIGVTYLSYHCGK